MRKKVKQYEKKYCKDCGGEKEYHRVPTNEYSEETGERIYKDVFICMNEACIDGKLGREYNLCPYYQKHGSHDFHAFLGLFGEKCKYCTATPFLFD